MDSNIADKLKAMLEDPDTLNTLSSILGSMQPSNSVKSEPEVTADTDAELPAEQSTPDPTQAISQIARMLSSTSAADDPRINLLTSLKPYMRKSRSAKMDQAIKLIQISKMASVFNQNRQ